MILDKKELDGWQQDYFGATPPGAMALANVLKLLKAVDILTEALKKTCTCEDNAIRGLSGPCFSCKKLIDVWGPKRGKP